MSRTEAGLDVLPARLPEGLPKGQALREVVESLVGALGPGAPLPSERVLAERFGLARMTVRTEVDRLVSEGLVYRLHGRGTFVAEPRVAQAVRFSSFSEDMRARGLRPGSVTRSQGVIEAGPFLAGSLELAQGDPVVEIERVRTADGEPMALERVYLSGERFPGIAEADLSDGSLFELLSGRHGVELAEARQRVVAVEISAEEAELLRVDENEPGLRFHTLACGADGTPVYYATSLFRGDRYEIELRQTRSGDEEGLA
jgi:GntR family transcriptional regulator